MSPSRDIAPPCVVDGSQCSSTGDGRGVRASALSSWTSDSSAAAWSIPALLPAPSSVPTSTGPVSPACHPCFLPKDVVQLAQRRIQPAYRHRVLAGRIMALLGAAVLPLTHLYPLPTSTTPLLASLPGLPPLALAGAAMAAASNLLLMLGALIAALPARYSPIYSQHPVMVNAAFSVAHAAAVMVAWAVSPTGTSWFVRTSFLIAVLADLSVCLTRVTFDMTCRSYLRLAMPGGHGKVLFLPLPLPSPPPMPPAADDGRQQHQHSLSALDHAARLAPSFHRSACSFPGSEGPEGSGALQCKPPTTHGAFAAAASSLVAWSTVTQPEVVREHSEPSTHIASPFGPAVAMAPSEGRALALGNPAEDGTHPPQSGSAAQEFSLTELASAHLGSSLAAASSSLIAPARDAASAQPLGAALECQRGLLGPGPATGANPARDGGPLSSLPPSAPAAGPTAAAARVRHSFDLVGLGGARDNTAGPMTGQLGATGFSTGGLLQLNRSSFDLARGGPGAGEAQLDGAAEAWAQESMVERAAARRRRACGAVLAAVAEAAAEFGASSAETRSSDLCSAPPRRNCLPAGTPLSLGAAGPCQARLQPLPLHPLGLQPRSTHACAIPLSRSESLPASTPPPWTPRPAATVAGAASAAINAVDPFAAYGLDEAGSAPLLRLGGGGGASRCGNYRAWQLPTWRDELNYMYLAHVDEADVISGRVRHVDGVEVGRAATAAVAAVATVSADREAARASGGAGLPTTPPLEVAYDINEYVSPFTDPYDLADKNTACDQGMYRNTAYGVYLEGYTSAVSSNGSSQQVSHALLGYGSAPSLQGRLGAVRTAISGSPAAGTNSRPISALRPFPEPSGGAGSQALVSFGPPVATPYDSPRASMDVALANAVQPRLAAPPPPPSAWGTGSVGVAPAPALARVSIGPHRPVPAGSNSAEATASAGAMPTWAAALVALPHSVLHSRKASASTDGSATGAPWRPPHPLHCLPARSSSAAALTASAAAVGTPRFSAGGGGGVWRAAQPPLTQAAAGSPRRVPQRSSRAAAVNATAAVAVKARRPRAQSHWYWDPALGCSPAVSAAGSSSGFRGSAGLGGGSALDTIHEEGQHATHDAPTDQAPPPPNTSPDAADILDALPSGPQDVVLSEGEPSFGPVSPGQARALMGACRGAGQACDEHYSSGHGQPAERLHKVTSLPDLRGPPGPSQRASPPPPGGHVPRGGGGVQSGFRDRKWSHTETVSGAAATAAAAAAVLLLRPMSAAAAAAATAALAAPPSGSPDGAAGPAAQRRSLDDYWVAWALGSGLCVGMNTPTSSGSGNARATAAAPTAAGRVSVDVAVEALLGTASTPAPPTPAAAVADRAALDAILLSNAAGAPPPPLPAAVTAASANANASANADGDGFTFTRPHPASSGARRPRLHHHYRLDSFLTAANAQPYSHNSTARHATGSGVAAPTAKDATAGTSANAAVSTAAAGAWGWSRAGTVNGSAAPCPRGSLSRLSISSAAAEPGLAVGPALAPAPARALVPARPLAAC